MNPETRTCQNCENPFTIAPADFDFYHKVAVPPPTWCPECRMIRRFGFRNEGNLFRRKDAHSGKDIFSSFPAAAPMVTYETDFWFSDGWDAYATGKDYDFTRPFFAQFRDLLYTAPVAAKSVLGMVDSDYSDQAGWLKNCYLCFSGGESENSAYVRTGYGVKESFDLYESRHAELCYENYMVDESFRVFYSTNIEDSTDIWFSKDLVGCNNCFGCVNLRNKSYHVFNEPYGKEAYREFLKAFRSGSHEAVRGMREKALAFWKRHPVRFTLSIACTNSTGEHIERSKNLTRCYSIHEGENLAYCQMLEPPCTDSYDYTNFGGGADQMYETLTAGHQSGNLRFSWECWDSCRNLDYCVFCPSSSDCFGCVGLRGKKYCIFNKQYSKEEYYALRERIIAHMNDMPYADRQGKVYRYGEFFPPEFSPFAYNETIAQDFFPLTKEQAEAKGYLWREPDQREYQATAKASGLPDDIAEAEDDVVKEIIACGSCGKAYRVIPMELTFLRRIGLPLPRLCPACRFRERFTLVNPAKFWPGKCQCGGAADDRQIYRNVAPHAHGTGPCEATFDTSYAPGRTDIVYCAACYQSEVA